MNKIIASVGLVALGAANVQAQNAIQGPPAKWWNIQTTVRGFFDDNVNSVQNPGPHDHVYGFEVKPKVGVVFGNDQTSFSADYSYAFLHYDKRPAGNTERYDQNHTFNALLTHAFSERYTVHVRDQFVIGQEPDALRNDAAFHTPFRVPGDNIVNSGGIVFNAELTRLLGLEVGYDNGWYDYKDKLSPLDPGKNVSGGVVVSPSLSGLLDRIEQAAHVAMTWQVLPDTTARFGYRYGQVNYNGDEVISGSVSPRDATTLLSEDRDVRSHTLYVGVDHQFRPDFYGSVEAGASYYDYYNIDETSWGPYARLSLTYVYMQDSSAQIGFQEGRSATDVLGGTTKADIVRDTETSVVYARVRHKIVPNLFANVNGTFQNAIFKGGGSFDGMSERFYEFGANLEYIFNPHFSAHAGYDFDRLDSEIPLRSYTRNKIYIGATAGF
jgi:hypothetical protein